jgi:hypothetical protein
MLRSPLVQAAGKRSASPGVEAHPKDAPKMYGKALGSHLLLRLWLRTRWCLPTPFLSLAPWQLLDQKPISERRAHANAETLSSPLRCWKRVGRVKLRTCFVGPNVLESGRTVCDRERLNFEVTAARLLGLTFLAILNDNLAISAVLNRRLSRNREQCRKTAGKR